MRIGVMSPAGLGGSARIATELSVELARHGHRVDLFARTTPLLGWDPQGEIAASSSPSGRPVLHQSLDDDENTVHPGWQYVDWPAEELDRFLLGLLEVTDDEGLDILHFHYAIPYAAIAAELKRRLGDAAPGLVGTLHGTDVSTLGREPGRRQSLVQSLQALDALTTVSSHHARLAAEVFGLATPPEVIRNFVNLSRFRPLTASSGEPPLSTGESSPGARRPRIVHLSNFRPVKDPQSMARIFLGIRRQIDAELWLIGDGPERAGVEFTLEQGGAQADVRSWGIQREVAPLLSQADLLLMTSLAESFNLAALEAMACGVPVLATDVGGQPEVIIHGKTGFLFPPGDHRLAVELGVGLLTDPVRHRFFSRAAVARASRFSHRRVIPSYERLYRRVLEGKRLEGSSALDESLAGIGGKSRPWSLRDLPETHLIP